MSESMKRCDLCGAEIPKGATVCSRCGFEFQKEIRSDVRDAAILRKHGQKSVEEVNRELKNAQTRLTAYLDNMAARGLSKDELVALLDDALGFLQVPLSMGVEDVLRFNQQETGFIHLLASSLEKADEDNGTPVGTTGTYIRMSNALQALGMTENAMRMIENALLINPRDRDAMFARAILLFHAKKYPAARKCLEKIITATENEKAKYMLELIDQMSPA